MPRARPEPGPGLAVGALASALGASLLAVVAGPPEREVDDVTLAEPATGTYGEAGDLLLGVGVDGSALAVSLLERAGEIGSGGVVLRRSLASRREVRAAARRVGVTLLAVSDVTSWAHVVWLLQGLLERVATGVDEVDRLAGRDELFAIADACADLLNAPVTIEDTHSRVLAHSARQDVADPVRLTTIVGRRVPDAVLASLRGRGVFRRLARSGEPFFVPADGDLRARLVVPVRAGSEWLGSIWAVVDEPPEQHLVQDLTRTASTVALQLLRQRSSDDVARRLAAERLRAVLTGAVSGPVDWLPAPPWRVVVLDDDQGDAARRATGGPGVGPGDVHDRAGRGRERPAPVDPEARTRLWEAAVRQARWRRPLLAELGGDVVAVVRDAPEPDEPGTLGWLVRFVDAAASRPSESGGAGGLSRARGSAGSAVSEVTSLAASLREAREVRRAGELRQVDELRRVDELRGGGGANRGAGRGRTRMRHGGAGAGRITTIEDAWAGVSVGRAVAAVHQAVPRGPVATLAAHDREHGSAYMRTLAAWLDHPGNPRQAAAALHVHPNTLRYRMARIVELAELDLADPVVRLAVQLLLRVPGGEPHPGPGG